MPQELTFEELTAEPQEVSFEDLQEPEAPKLPAIRVEPWQEPGADLGPFGGYRPGTPGYAEHMREAAATLAVPPAAVGAAAEAIMEPITDLSVDLRRRLGIDPSAMPGQPIDILRFPRVKPPPPGTKYPAAIEHLNKAHEAAAEFLEGLTAPGMPETLAFGAAKPVQALFAASVAGAVPQSVEELAAAPEGPEKTKAGVKLGMNLAMGELMRRGLAHEPGVVAPPEPVARSRELVGPPVTGEMLRLPTGGTPTGIGEVPGEVPAPSTVVRVALPGSIPPESVVPAVRLIGGEIVRGRAGETHPDIISREGIKAEEIDQRGFVDAQGRFLDREAAAQGTQIPPAREPGRLHSTDLPAAKAEYEPTELDGIAQDLYGKPFEELTQYEQGQVRATFEHKAPEILKPKVEKKAPPAPITIPTEPPKKPVKPARTSVESSLETAIAALRKEADRTRDVEIPQTTRRDAARARMIYAQARSNLLEDALDIIRSGDTRENIQLRLQGLSDQVKAEIERYNAAHKDLMYAQTQRPEQLIEETRNAAMADAIAHLSRLLEESDVLRTGEATIRPPEAEPGVSPRQITSIQRRKAQSRAEAAAAAAAPTPTAPEVAPAGELPPLIEQPKAPKPLQAERRQIVRMLETLEEQDPKTGEFFAKEGQEDRVKRLRTRLADIEQQLLPKPAAPAVAPPANVILNRGNVETAAEPAPTSASPKLGFNAKQAKQQKKFLLDAAKQALEAAPDVESGQWQNPELQADWVRAGNSREGEPQRYGYGEQRTLTQEEYDALHAQWESAQSEQYRDLFEKYNIPKESPASIPYRDIAGEMQQSEKGGPLGFGQRIALLKEAITKANHELLPKITIEVPGDGVFTVENNRSVIHRLIRRAEEGEWFGKGEERFKAGPFPTTAPKVSEPKGVRTTPTAASALGKMDKESVVDSAALHVSTEPEREVLHYLWSDGKQTVAVDGRKLVRIQKGLGGSEANPKLFRTDGTPLTDAQAKKLKFPDYKQVIPEKIPLVAKGLDTQKLFTLLVQAEHTVSERSNSVKIWKNKDGSIAITSDSPEVGSYEGNLKPDAELLTAINPEYLRDIINSARKIGLEKIDLHISDELSPIMLKGPGFEAVLMPMRLSGRFPEVVGKALSRESIAARLREHHGIEEGEIVRIIDDPTERASARLIYDADRRPVGIEVNRAQIPSNGVLDWAIQHEAAHWFDLEHPQAAQNLRGRLTGMEWEQIQTQIERLGYRPEAFAVERTALGIQRLAEAWRGRNWFERMVGTVMRFASDTIGIKMSRLAAENTAVRAIAQAIGRIGAARPNEVSRILAMTPDEVIRWKRDTRYGAETMRQIASQVRPDQMGALVRERDKLRAQSTALSATREVPNIERALRVSLKAQTLNELIENAPRAGGVMEARAPGTPEPISELSDRLKATAPTGTRERLTARERIADAWAQGKTISQRAQAGAIAIGETIKDTMRGVRSPTELDRKVGELDFLLQRSAGQSREAGRVMARQIKDVNLRRAAALWIDTPGDAATKQNTFRQALRALPPDTPPAIRRAIETAADMPPEGIAFADHLREYFETRERDAVEHGLFGEMDKAGNIIQGGLDDYFTHIWGKESNMPDDLRAAISNGRVNTYWQFARHRTLGMFLDGIMAGKVPMLDPAKVIPYYNYTLDRSIASRSFIKQLADNVVASDGRAAVKPTGIVNKIGPGAPAAPDVTLVRPRGQMDEMKYFPIDHPAMRKWKWVTNDENGNPILSLNDLVVHPEFHDRIARFMDRGRLTPTRWGRRLLRASTEVKGFKLGLLSAFHQVHVGSHALFHWTLPFNFKDPAYFTADGRINWDSPQVRHAVEKGHLKLAPDPNELNVFAEGLLSPGLIHKLPIVGPWSRAYSEFVFVDLIPKLKLKTFANALPRNERWYAGKLTPEEIAARVGDSVNNAYGELNALFLGKMGRSPQFQRILRGIFLAPDFGEARLRFVTKAATKFGGEERLALATMFATLYLGARVGNWLTHGDPEADSLKRAFAVKVGKHWFSMRSVIGDLVHAMTEPGKFMYVRLNPLYSRTAADWLFGRDLNGRKLTPMQKLVTRPLQQFVPIQMGGLTRDDQKLWESAVTAMGLQTVSDSPQQDMYEAARKWAGSQPDPKIRREFERREQSVFAPSDYIKLRFALNHDDAQGAQQAYEELLATGHKPGDIYKAMHRDAPFSGSQANEWKFKASLNPVQRKLYDQAKRDRRQLFERFLKLKRTAAGSAPVSDSLTIEQ